MTRRLRSQILHPGFIPVLVVLAAWIILPNLVSLPPYQLPRFSTVATDFWTLLMKGTLLSALFVSLGRLSLAVVAGGVLGVLAGLTVTMSRAVREFLMPLAAFFNSIAGIAWIPMAIVWFGFGNGPAVFVIANNVFFIVLYNTLLGAQSIPEVLFRAVSVLGNGKRWEVWREVLLPGAMVGVLGGFRTGLAFAWRALIAVEFITATNGLGYLSIQASRYYDGATVIVIILVTGSTWLVLDRLLLRPVEALTIQRWGMMAGLESAVE